jgi:acyl carrier protein
MQIGKSKPEAIACDLIARALNFQGEVSASDSMSTLPAWDSLSHMTIVLELERQLKRTLAPEEVAGVTSVAAIAELISKE